MVVAMRDTEWSMRAALAAAMPGGTALVFSMDRDVACHVEDKLYRCPDCGFQVDVDHATVASTKDATAA